MAEIDRPDLYNWVVQKDTDEIRIWTRKVGLPSAAHLPLFQVEYYFPHIDDPRILQATILDFRDRFDTDQKERIERLPTLENNNTAVHHIVCAATLVAARDSVEKRFYFHASDALENLTDEERAAELRNGSVDDFYAWCTDIPEELHMPPSGVVRIERKYGFNMIGRIADLPQKRRGNHTTGCYFHNMTCMDLKINSWAYAMGVPFMIKGLGQWFKNMDKFAVANHEMLQ